MNLTKIGKFLCLILRHKPETIGITLDNHGWANVDELIKGVNGQYNFDMEALEKIVATDSKQRYSFNEDKTKIRANQGHSINVDVELEEAAPPEYLYHGTATKNMDSIWKTGLVPQSRIYVHLSADTDTALNVGKRHGKPTIFRVRSKAMHDQGFVFYKSQNGVWMTEKVPVEFIEWMWSV